MEGWFPGAVIIPGPAWKQGYGEIRRRTRKGLLGHSAEGELPGLLARLGSNAEVSWTGTFPAVGGVIQHYPLSAVCWHGGSPYPNTRWAGWEFEGRAGEPITPAQLAAAVAVFGWQAEQEEWPEVRLAKDTGTLHEHNWYYPTACPSGRIPWEEIISRMAIDEQARKDIALLKMGAEAQRIAGLVLQGKWQEAANALKFWGTVAQ